MLDNPSFTSFPLGLRIGLLIALIFLTIRYTRRGMQNGILLGLITGMSSNDIILFRNYELLRGVLPNISLDRIVWLIVLIIFFLKRRRGETVRLPFDWIERSIFVLIIVMLISMFGHGSYTDPSGEWKLFKFIRGYACPFAAYFIARRAIKTPQQLHGFLVGLGFIALYFVLVGLAEVWHINWLIFPQFILNPNLGTHSGRPRGMFLNASAFGLAIATVLPFLVWLYFSDRAPRRYVWPLIAVLGVIPLFFTFQRAAWLSAIVGIGVTALVWPRRRVILIGFPIFFGACGILFAGDIIMKKLEARISDKATIDYRFSHIQRGLAMFQANPVFGIGLNRYALEVEKYSSWKSTLSASAHNTWITLLAELGLAGFLPYTLIFGLVLFESIMFCCQLPPYRVILGILIGITLGFLAMSISMEVRGLLYANALIFTLWGVILQIVRSQVVFREKQAVAYQRVVNFL
jgi:O-antigen ligase